VGRHTGCVGSTTRSDRSRNPALAVTEPGSGGRGLPDRAASISRGQRIRHLTLISARRSGRLAELGIGSFRSAPSAPLPTGNIVLESSFGSSDFRDAVRRFGPTAPEVHFASCTSARRLRAPAPVALACLRAQEPWFVPSRPPRCRPPRRKPGRARWRDHRRGSHGDRSRRLGDRACGRLCRPRARAQDDRSPRPTAAAITWCARRFAP
jgi:hypothetical protein